MNCSKVEGNNAGLPQGSAYSCATNGRQLKPTAHFSLRLDTHNSFCQTLQQSMAAGGESLEAPKAERQQHTADRTGDDRDTQQARESHG